MPDYMWVQNPVFPPTTCAGCNTHRHEDGFVDLLAEDVAGRRFYLCASCVYTAGQKVGCLSPAQAADLTERLTAAQDEMLNLRLELESEKENKLVSLADVKELVRQRGGRPSAPAAA